MIILLICLYIIYIMPIQFTGGTKTQQSAIVTVQSQTLQEEIKRWYKDNFCRCTIQPYYQLNLESMGEWWVACQGANMVYKLIPVEYMSEMCQPWEQQCQIISK